MSRVIAHPPRWLTIGLQSLGTKEIPGKATSPVIRRWLIELNAWWRDDETPWCGVFVAHCLRTAGKPVPKHWYRALAYADYGVELPRARLGAIAVMKRPGGGHVFLVLGFDHIGRIIGLGGNQRNAVSLAVFEPGSILTYRAPFGASPLGLAPTLGSDAIENIELGQLA
jgi:uncharacterized protein (TIGR02594 family)